ncbi:conserved protein of unknown function [Nitrospira japonica]|uniref:AsmA-like C-terminal domain-containing protein n=2 Tax=Nitrospira japonica TaxID=1325564 RepID=A0A1W1I797_9BACT|nr:conserved protein of unknown function [Nitrospira japonica]
MGRMKLFAIILAVFLVLVGGILVFVDEPLRAYAERQLNEHVEGYTFKIGGLSFHLLGFSIDLTDITVRQSAHPDPPIAKIPKWHASEHWRELLSGTLVSDHKIDHPVLHVVRVQAVTEAKEGKAVSDRGWQDAVLAIYPLNINELQITDADITYSQHNNAKPLHVSHANFQAGNIRNVRSQEAEYPSTVHLDAIVFDKGRLAIDGHADFLSEPFMGVNVDIDMDDMPLVDWLPVTAERQIHLTQGQLSMKGHVEFSPKKEFVECQQFTLRDAKVDFVHSARTKETEKQTGATVADAADEAANHPRLLLRINRGTIANGEFGFVNREANPRYRVFISGTTIDLENWSNQLTEGVATVKLKGMFMGNGETDIQGAFRPETQSPDFDLNLRIWKTHVKSMNDLLRAHGNLDVVTGVFSVFAEMHVRNGTIRGYLKPLFKDIQAYDPAQDRDKGTWTKIYQKIVDAAAALLRNTPRKEVATKTELSGPVKNPQASTWELVVKLIQNAFFEAVLPGFEKLPKAS